MRLNLFSLETIKHLFQDLSIVSSQEEKEKRMNICNECSFLEGDFCSACSCFLPIKITFVSSFCPKGKWEAKIS